MSRNCCARPVCNFNSDSRCEMTRSLARDSSRCDQHKERKNEKREMRLYYQVNHSVIIMEQTLSKDKMNINIVWLFVLSGGIKKIFLYKNKSREGINFLHFLVHPFGPLQHHRETRVCVHGHKQHFLPPSFTVAQRVALKLLLLLRKRHFPSRAPLGYEVNRILVPFFLSFSLPFHRQQQHQGKVENSRALNTCTSLSLSFSKK